MKLKDLERKGHLYYANSTSDTCRLEEAITCGIYKNQFDGLWFGACGIYLFTDIDIAVRVSLMEREHKKDRYGFVIIINPDDLSKRVSSSVRPYLPFGTTGRLDFMPINRKDIDCVYLFDFVGDQKGLAIEAQNIEKKYGINTRASRVYTRRQGNLTNLLAQELRISQRQKVL